jgi:hypothetical protein
MLSHDNGELPLPRTHGNPNRLADRRAGGVGVRHAANTGVTPVGWVPPDDRMDHPQWVAVGRRLGGISRSNQWWLGDWLRYGTAKWGERYVEAAKITGYDVRSLANIASLAGCFEMSRRRDNLSWSHHAVVATLEPDEQDRWLDLAAAGRLSVADLRIELHSAERRRDARERACGQPAEDDVSAFICPQCGYRASRWSAGAVSASPQEPANG